VCCATAAEGRGKRRTRRRAHLETEQTARENGAVVFTRRTQIIRVFERYRRPDASNSGKRTVVPITAEPSARWKFRCQKRTERYGCRRESKCGFSRRRQSITSRGMATAFFYNVFNGKRVAHAFPILDFEYNVKLNLSG